MIYPIPTDKIIHHHIMNQGAKRSILRWIHILFGLPIFGYIYGPAEEVAQYAPFSGLSSFLALSFRDC